MGWLSSFFGFDDKPAAPTVVQQTSKIPEELAPYVKQILGEAQTLYEKQKERGYDPYTGETIAPLTPEELEAQEGLKGLVGTTQPYLQEALDIYRTGAEKFTPEAAQEYMSPYQRAVTDIEKREAQKVFERDIMPRFEKQAVQAGGMSGLGSRAGVQAGQLGQAQMQQMGDIEAKGLQRAYMDAQRGFEAQKARERQLAGDVGRTGPAMLQAGLAEQGILQDIGQQKREMAQGALDEAYYKFLKEEAYPQDILASYSGTTYGASPFVGPSGTKTYSGGPEPYRQSPGQQLLGLGMAGLNIYGMGGGFGSSTLGKAFQAPGGGTRSLFSKKGGQIESGLSGLPVVRRQSGSTRANPSGYVWDPDKPTYDLKTLEGQEKLEAAFPTKPKKPSLQSLLYQQLRGLTEESKLPERQKLIREKLTKASPDIYDPAKVETRMTQELAKQIALKEEGQKELAGIETRQIEEDTASLEDYETEQVKTMDYLKGWPGHAFAAGIQAFGKEKGIIRGLTAAFNVSAEELTKRTEKVNKLMREFNKEVRVEEKAIKQDKKASEISASKSKQEIKLTKLLGEIGIQTTKRKMPEALRAKVEELIKSEDVRQASNIDKIYKLITGIASLSKAESAGQTASLKLMNYLLDVEKLGADKIKTIFGNIDLASINPQAFAASLRDMNIREDLIQTIMKEAANISSSKAPGSIPTVVTNRNPTSPRVIRSLRDTREAIKTPSTTK